MLDSRTTSCGLEHQLLVPVVGVARLVEQQLRRPPAQLLPRLAHRRQRDGGGRGEVDVVVADDREVVGHPHAVPHHLLQQPERQQVVGADRRGGPPGGGHADDLLAGLPAAGDGERPRARARSARRRTRSASRTARTTPSCRSCTCGRPDDAADEGDPPVAALEQVVGGQPAAEDVVDGDRALVGAGRAAVDAARPARRARAAPRGAGESSAVGVMSTPWTPLLGEHVEVRGLLGRPVVGVAQDDGQALGVRHLLDAAGDVGEERVGDVEDDQADRAAASRRAGGGPTRCGRSRASAIAVEDPLAGRLADRRRAG